MQKTREELLQKTEENAANPRKAGMERVRPDPRYCWYLGYSWT